MMDTFFLYYTVVLTVIIFIPLYRVIKGPTIFDRLLGAGAIGTKTMGLFLIVGSIGLIRLPDFYSRNHATGKSDTLGIMLVIFGLILLEGFSLNSAKLFFAFIFVFLTNPTGTHALTNAALNSGLQPWFRKNTGKGDGAG